LRKAISRTLFLCPASTTVRASAPTPREAGGSDADAGHVLSLDGGLLGTSCAIGRATLGGAIGGSQRVESARLGAITRAGNRGFSHSNHRNRPWLVPAEGALIRWAL